MIVILDRQGGVRTRFGEGPQSLVSKKLVLGLAPAPHVAVELEWPRWLTGAEHASKSSARIHSDRQRRNGSP